MYEATGVDRLGEAVEIGAVDSRGVRVWLRAPGQPSVEVEWEVAGHGPATRVTVPLDPTGDWTGSARLDLTAPAPDAPFAVQALGRRVRGRLAPADGALASFSFAFGSCHQPFDPAPEGVTVAPRAAIYPAMTRELARIEADFLLLTGDQIYSDALPALDVRAAVAQGMPARAAYHRAYRAYFGESGFRTLRASLPTLCMWDDHEIINDWGSRREREPGDAVLFRAAAVAYRDYQDGRNPRSGVGPPAHYRFRRGNAGFLVLDVRGARDYEQGRILGGAQWDEVRGWLHDPAWNDVDTLFVVTSVPVAHAARWFTRAFEHFPIETADAVRDRWTSTAFLAGRDALLTELFAWQAARPRRQVALLSGDVHCAGAAAICHSGEPGVIWQFTSSALTTRPSTMERILSIVATRLPNVHESEFRFERRFLSFRNNYGLVQLRALPGGGHRVIFTARGWHPRRQRLVTLGRVVAAPAQIGPR